MQFQRAMLISPTQMTFFLSETSRSPQRLFLNKVIPCCYYDLIPVCPLQCVTKIAANTTGVYFL